MSPDQWLEKNYLKEIFSGKFEHLKEIVDGLGLRPTSTIVTIAGTNGKGETARTLDFILSQSGKKTALLTSPHLEKVNETCFRPLFKVLNEFQRENSYISYVNIFYFEMT